jgi:transposase
MGYHKIEDDVSRVAVRLLRKGKMEKEEIAEVCGFSLRTFNRTLERLRESGSISHKPHIRHGPLPFITPSDLTFLVRLAEYKPTTFLVEYCNLLEDSRLLSVHITTIHRAFRKAGISVKRLQKLAAERSPEDRADYQRRIGRYASDQLVFLDEMSKDDRTYARLFGRAPKGARVEEDHPFVRRKRFSTVAALALDQGIIAANVIEGSFDRDKFIEFLQNDVVCSPSVCLNALLTSDWMFSSLCAILTLPETVFLCWIMHGFIMPPRFSS